MCLLTYFPPGVQPDTEALANGSFANNDGHGFAIVADNELIVEKSLDAESLIELFADMRRLFPDGPALFHSRFGTGGTTTLDNCHPFAVGGDKRTVIAHNGVLPRGVQPTGKETRSDTRIAAEDFIPAVGPLSRRRVRLHLERWMGPNNKIVILTVDRRFRGNAFVLNEASGIWDRGVWYSNRGYEDTYTWGYGSGYTLGKRYKATRWDRREFYVGKFSGIRYCIWCYEQEENCVCYCTECGYEHEACLCYAPTVSNEELVDAE